MMIKWFLRRGPYRHDHKPVGSEGLVCSEGRDYKAAVLEGGLLYVKWMGGGQSCYPLTEIAELSPALWPAAVS